VGNFKDLTGQRFGRLVAVKKIEEGKHAKWLFQCDCGNEHVAQQANVLGGRHTRSCGCLAREVAVTSNTTHGMCHTRVYAIYAGVKSRCRNKNNHAYSVYGGRGLTVCDEWLNDPQSFFDWAINNGYADNLTIDRKDNDKGYSPDNCRWSTAKEQSRNRRSNVVITVNGTTKLAVDWARELNIAPAVITKRIRRGWDAVDAVVMPLKPGGKRSQDDFNKAKLLFAGVQ